MKPFTKYIGKKEKWEIIRSKVTKKHINFLLILSGRGVLSHFNLNCKIKKRYLYKGIKKTARFALKSLYNEKESSSSKKVSISRSNFVPNSDVWSKSLAR